MGGDESQGKRQFQIAHHTQDNTKLKIVTQRAHYLQFNFLDTLSNTRYSYRRLEAIRYQKVSSLESSAGRVGSVETSLSGTPWMMS